MTPEGQPAPISPDEIAPKPAQTPEVGEIPEGIDTAPEGSPEDPQVPGQPERPDVVGGL